MSAGILFMIPTPLTEGNARSYLPEETLLEVKKIRYFLCESQKAGFRFLVGIGMKQDLESIEFGILNEHTKVEEFGFLLQPLLDGKNCGIITDAGCPGVADPGAEIARLAHAKGLRVRPLIGPSSILLAIMGSGLNGQSFSFVGYLPVKNHLRIRRIKELEQRSKLDKSTQIFIETPYRNRQLFDDLCQVLLPGTLLTLAVNLTAENEYLETMTVQKWKSISPDFHKVPTVFLFQAQ